MTKTLSSNRERIEKHIQALAEFNATPGKGITRFSYSEEDRKARDYLIDKMEELGLSVRIDPIGNIRARLEGSSPGAAPVLTGSHIDTVVHGGRFDGVVGVVCALEALAVFADQGFTPERPVEMIVFVEEEGANFGSPLAGSKTLVGTYSSETLKSLVNDLGVSMYEAAKSFGLDPDSMEKELLRPGQISAMIEIHIEQSLVLDSEKIPVGVVSGIAGMKWIGVELLGQPDHAGATPMRYRRDPMAGAAEVISAVEETAKNGAFPTTVGTVGKIICTPNIPNVIPEKVRFVVDIRDVDKEGIDRVFRALTQKLEQVSGERDLSFRVEDMNEIEPTLCSERVVKALRKSAERRGIPYKMMMSGALHDTAVLASITDIGMLFVPSKKGRSHVPEEETDLGDIKKGCDVLIGALMEAQKI